MRMVCHDTVVRRLLCLLLCVATWRAPVVWVHSHSDHESNEAADSRLTSHLQRFHHEPKPTEEGSRWHIHIGLLRDLMSDCPDDLPSSQSSAEEPICLSAAPGHSALALSGFDVSADAIWILTPVQRPSHSASPTIPRGSFLQTYGTAPLRALTCVIRC